MNLVERPCNEREYYDYQNNSGATLTQFHFVLWDSAGDGTGIPLPVFANIPDHNGILNEAWGKIESQVGSVWQINQLDNDIINFAHARGTVVYMAPGSGNVHATPVEGDYKVGFLTIAHVAGVTYVTMQLTPPERVSDDEIAT